MPVSIKDYIDSADLMSQGASEIDWRNAVSRAYYGSFHWALANVEFCKTLPYGADQAGSHERVIKRFEHHGDSAAKSIAYMLMELKTKRKIADYQLDANVKRFEATTMVANARKVVERVSAFVKVPSPLADPLQDSAAG